MGSQELRATRDRLVAGRLDLHRDGYGFVRPNGSTNRDDDLFIPPNELNGAMQGDEVLVDEAPPGAGWAALRPHRARADATKSYRGRHLPLRAGAAQPGRMGRCAAGAWQLCHAAG